MSALRRAVSLAPSLAALALLAPLVSTAAFAAAATTSQTVNLRAGPAASYDVVGQLQGGQAVDVRQCEGTFCQVAYGGKTGWVSASFLTRGGTPSATTSTVAALPSAAPASPGPAARTPSTAPGEPQIAATTPHKPAPTIAAPPPAPMTVSPPPPAPVPPAYAVAPIQPLPPVSRVASADDDSAVTDSAPRPKVDIPGPSDAIAAPGDDDNMASADNSDDDDALAPDDNDGPDDNAVTAPPPPDFGPRGYAPRGFRRDFASLGVGPAHACFVDADGGNGFCVREGQTIADPGRWSRHAMLLRNPGRLNVVVCTAPDECHTYVASGPVLVGGRPIATISVAAPGY
jgi:uncharacterized protein YraI